MKLADLKAHPGDAELTKIRSDRRFLELALEEAGRLLGHKPRIAWRACDCPFHNDDRQSAGIAQAAGDSCIEWLFKCPACGGNGVVGGWNTLDPQQPRDSGDAIDVLRNAYAKSGQSMGLESACDWLLDAHAQQHQPYSITIVEAPKVYGTSQESAEDVDEAAEEALTAHDILRYNSSLLARLRAERAIEKSTVKRFTVGYMEDAYGREWWVFPVKDAKDQFMVQKRHAADGKTPKGEWHPAGAKVGTPLFPVDLSKDGVVWLCPGELKALAVISLGLPAIGWTCGESVSNLPPSIIKSLHGRKVGIAADNDTAGKSWAASVQSQLQGAGVEAHVVALGCDIGDWIVRRYITENAELNLVRFELQKAYEKAAQTVKSASEKLKERSEAADDDAVNDSDCMSPIQFISEVWADDATWKPVERIRTHITTLDNLLHGGYVVGGVHLLVGKPGNCKTQLAVQIAVNAALNGTPVGFISLEMDKYEVSRLTMAQLSDVPRRTIDAGMREMAGTPDQEKVRKVVKTTGGMPFQLIDGEQDLHGFTRKHVDSTVASGVRKNGWKLVVLDHLGELAPSGGDSSDGPLQNDKVNIGALRATAKRHKVALVVVAPLRKSAKSGASLEDEVTLEDVLGSAAVGYAVSSCAVVAADRAESPPDCHVNLRLLKQRNGPLPNKPLILAWNPTSGRIGDRQLCKESDGDVLNACEEILGDLE